jgi:hypothetical protein
MKRKVALKITEFGMDNTSLTGVARTPGASV